MNDIEIMNAYIIGTDPKAIQKKGISKTRAYRIYSRYTVIVKPILDKLIMLSLNIGTNGFRGVRENKLKSVVMSELPKKSFSMPPMKPKKQVDDEADTDG